MHKPILFAALLLLSPGAVHAHSQPGCSCEFAYDLRLDGEAVELGRENHVYRFEADRLLRDGRELSLSAGQHRAAAQYREGLQELVPAISELAVQGAMLGLEAANLSIATLSDDSRSSRALQQRSAVLAESVHTRFNGRELHRDDGEFDAALEAQIESLAEDMAAELSGSIAKLVFTALINPARLEARSEISRELIEHRLDARAAELEKQARPLCARMRELDRLEAQLGIDAIRLQTETQKPARGTLSF